jgi:hypothetical protein
VRFISLSAMLVHPFLRHGSEYLYAQIQIQTPNIRLPKARRRASNLARFHLHRGRGLGNRSSTNCPFVTANFLAAADALAADGRRAQ